MDHSFPTLDASGGVCCTHDLTAAGWTSHEIRHAVHHDALIRLRRGWYAAPGADGRVVRAVTTGGALGCASALAFRGAWDVTGHTIHVRTDHNHSTHLPPGLRHCHSMGDRDDLAPRHAVDDLPVALRAAWRCLGPEDLVVVCDSLLHTGLMTSQEMHQAIGPQRGRDGLLGRCDRAESGTETLVRLRLRRRGIKVRTQVVVPGIGRVDLLVGDRLVIEVDSVAHHTSWEQYRSDRRRDLALRAQGYVVVRLTYEQVMFDWPATEQALVAMVRRGDHWWPARSTRRRSWNQT